MTLLLNYFHLGLSPPERTDPVVVVIILLVIAGAIVFSLIWRRRQKAQLLRDIRLYWGLPRTPIDEKEFEKIGLYYRLKPHSSGDALDDKTWADLDFDQVFEFIDRTSSRVGQQYLYDLLRTPKFEEEPLLKRSFSQRKGNPDYGIKHVGEEHVHTHRWCECGIGPNDSYLFRRRI